MKERISLAFLWAFFLSFLSYRDFPWLVGSTIGVPLWRARDILFHQSSCSCGRKCEKKEEEEEKKQEEAALFASQACWERRTRKGIQRTKRLNAEWQKI